jgi:hypothetical protein
MPLVGGAPPRSADEHDLQLVTVLETEDSFALGLAKASLEGAGIDYLVSGDDPRNFGPYPVTHLAGQIPLCGCSCRIQVTPEHEAEARALLDPLRNPDLAIELEADLEAELEDEGRSEGG